MKEILTRELSSEWEDNGEDGEFLQVLKTSLKIYSQLRYRKKVSFE